MPQYVKLPNNEYIEFPDDMDEDTMYLNTLRYLNMELPDRSWVDAAKDIGLGIAKGFPQVGQMAADLTSVGAAALPDTIGDPLQRFAERSSKGYQGAVQSITGMQSPQLQADLRNMQNYNLLERDEEGNVVDVSLPPGSVVTDIIASSLTPGGVIGKGGSALSKAAIARGAPEAIARVGGFGAANVAGVAPGQYQQTKEEAFQYYLDQGYDEQEAARMAESAGLEAAAMMAGVSGLTGGLGTAAAAASRGNIIARGLKGGLKEAPGEAIEEAAQPATTDIALDRPIDTDKAITAGALGAIAGVGQGAPIAALEGRADVPSQRKIGQLADELPALSPEEEAALAEAQGLSPRDTFTQDGQEIISPAPEGTLQLPPPAPRPSPGDFVVSPTGETVRRDFQPKMLETPRYSDIMVASEDGSIRPATESEVWAVNQRIEEAPELLPEIERMAPGVARRASQRPQLPAPKPSSVIISQPDGTSRYATESEVDQVHRTLKENEKIFPEIERTNLGKAKKAAQQEEAAVEESAEAKLLPPPKLSETIVITPEGDARYANETEILAAQQQYEKPIERMSAPLVVTPTGTLRYATPEEIEMRGPAQRPTQQQPLPSSGQFTPQTQGVANVQSATAPIAAGTIGAQGQGIGTPAGIATKGRTPKGATKVAPGQTKSAQKSIGQQQTKGKRGEMYSTTETVPAPDFAADRPRIIADVYRIAKRINPNVTVEFVDKLFGMDPVRGEMEVAGSYTPAIQTARISLNLGKYDPYDTIFHEMFHSLQMGLLTTAEQNILSHAYPGSDVNNSWENQATAFADWAKNRAAPGFIPSVRRAFQKIHTFLANVGNLLRGQGFNSVSQIFENAYNGKMSERTLTENMPEVLAEEYYSVGQQAGNTLAQKVTNSYNNLFQFSSRPLAYQLGAASSLFVSNDARLKYGESLAAKQGRPKAAKVFRTVKERLYAEAGSGRAVSETYDEAMTRRIATSMRAIHNATKDIDAATLEKITPYIQTPTLITNPRTDPIQAAAAKLIAVLDRHAKYLVKEGYLPANFAETEEYAGYFPREYKWDQILENPADFMQKATQAYAALDKQNNNQIYNGDPAEHAKAAFRWHEAIRQRQLEYDTRRDAAFTFRGGMPVPQNLKNRRLPKEADDLLRDYLEQNPVTAIQSMVARTTRRVEFDKRFGVSAINDLREMGKGEVTEDDWDIIINSIQSSTQTMALAMSKRARENLSWASLATNLAFLSRSTLSSLTEGTLTGIRTRNVWDSFVAYKDAVNAMMKGKSTEDARIIAEEILGVAGDVQAEMMMAMRTGMENLTQRQRFITDKYFRAIGQTALTDSFRISAIASGQRYMNRLANAYLYPNDAKNAAFGLTKNWAERIMMEFGIPKNKLSEFSQYVVTNGLNSKNLKQMDEMAELGRLAMMRFSDGISMRPKAVERQYFANHPFGRMIYGLQSFLMSFAKQVVLRDIKYTMSAANLRNGMTVADRLAVVPTMLAYGLLLGATYWTRLLRDELFSDPNKMPTDPSQRLMATVSQAGLLGGLDPYINIITGARYQRDPATVLSGPFLGLLGEGVSAIAQSMTETNSENTNTAERKLGQALYSMLVIPAANAGLMMLPGGRLGTIAGAAGVQTVSAPQTRAAVIDTVFGEKMDVGNARFQYVRRQVNDLYNRIEQAKDSGDRETLREIMADPANRTILRYKNRVDAMQKPLAKIAKERKALYVNKSMSEDRKDRMREALDRREERTEEAQDKLYEDFMRDRKRGTETGTDAELGARDLFRAK